MRATLQFFFAVATVLLLVGCTRDPGYADDLKGSIDKDVLLFGDGIGIPVSYALTFRLGSVVKLDDILQMDSAGSYVVDFMTSAAEDGRHWDFPPAFGKSQLLVPDAPVIKTELYNHLQENFETSFSLAAFLKGEPVCEPVRIGPVCAGPEENVVVFHEASLACIPDSIAIVDICMSRDGSPSENVSREQLRRCADLSAGLYGPVTLAEGSYFNLEEILHKKKSFKDVRTSSCTFHFRYDNTVPMSFDCSISVVVNGTRIRPESGKFMIPGGECSGCFSIRLSSEDGSDIVELSDPVFLSEVRTCVEHTSLNGNQYLTLWLESVTLDEGVTMDLGR